MGNKKHKKIVHDYEIQKQNHLEKLATSLLATQEKNVKFKSKTISKDFLNLF
jgi:hypothetical protein